MFAGLWFEMSTSKQVSTLTVAVTYALGVSSILRVNLPGTGSMSVTVLG
jgi:H+/gluconate symporter-like permease